VVEGTSKIAPRLLGAKGRRLAAPGGPRTSWGLDLLQREVLSPPVVESLTGVDPTRFDGLDHCDDSLSYRSLVEAELAHYLQRVLLPDADAFSMRWSVELRVPFVDQPLFATATAVHSERRRFTGKRVLAEALRDPHLLALSRQPKRGFSVPMARWLESGVLAPLAADLDRADAPVWSVVSRNAGRQVLEQPSTGRWSGRWALVALNAWMQSVASARQPPSLG
jgi:asparagine synthase (glutamine-hydrolysing)